MQPEWKKDVPVLVVSSMSEIVVSLADTVQEPGSVDVLAPPWPPPPVPPVPLVSLSLPAQEVPKIAKAPHATSEVKARLALTIELFFAFMSPSWLVFA
jgi:hypothetical protein